MSPDRVVKRLAILGVGIFVASAIVVVVTTILLVEVHWPTAPVVMAMCVLIGLGTFASAITVGMKNRAELKQAKRQAGEHGSGTD